MTDHSQTVLIVEDNALLRMDAVSMVQDEGFTVFAAENADHAIAILEAHPEIGLVFTDIEMPGSMDGLKLAEFVRHRWPPVHLIVASGKVPRDKAVLPEGGLFFAKPYSPVEILTAMRTLLAR